MKEALSQLFDVMDYRLFLKACYEERKVANRYYSYKIFANALGMDQSQLAKIIMGHLHLPSEKIDLLTSYLGLQGVATRYFECLVHFGRAATPAAAKVWFEKIQALRPPSFRALPESQHHYFSHWFTPVVRSIVDSTGQVDAEEIATQVSPAISVSEARNALDTLMRLGMLHQVEGCWILAEPHVGSGNSPRSTVLREYHRQVLGIAQDALDAVPVEERDISSLTAALDDAAMQDIRVMIRDFRMALQKRIGQIHAPARKVYQINFQLIPVTRCLEKAKP